VQEQRIIKEDKFTEKAVHISPKQARRSDTSIPRKAITTFSSTSFEGYETAMEEVQFSKEKYRKAEERKVGEKLVISDEELGRDRGEETRKKKDEFKKKVDIESPLFEFKHAETFKSSPKGPELIVPKGVLKQTVPMPTKTEDTELKVTKPRLIEEKAKHAEAKPIKRPKPAQAEQTKPQAKRLHVEDAIQAQYHESKTLEPTYAKAKLKQAMLVYAKTVPKLSEVSMVERKAAKQEMIEKRPDIQEQQKLPKMIVEKEVTKVRVEKKAKQLRDFDIPQQIKGHEKTPKVIIEKESEKLRIIDKHVPAKPKQKEAEKQKQIKYEERIPKTIEEEAKKLHIVEIDKAEIPKKIQADELKTIKTKAIPPKAVEDKEKREERAAKKYEKLIAPTPIKVEKQAKDKEMVSKAILEKEDAKQKHIPEKQVVLKLKQQLDEEKLHVKSKETTPKTMVGREVKEEKRLTKKHADTKSKQQIEEKRQHIKAKETTPKTSPVVKTEVKQLIEPEKLKQVKIKEVTPKPMIAKETVKEGRIEKPKEDKPKQPTDKEAMLIKAKLPAHEMIEPEKKARIPKKSAEAKVKQQIEFKKLKQIKEKEIPPKKIREKEFKTKSITEKHKDDKSKQLEAEKLRKQLIEPKLLKEVEDKKATPKTQIAKEVEIRKSISEKHREVKSKQQIEAEKKKQMKSKETTPEAMPLVEKQSEKEKEIARKNEAKQLIEPKKLKQSKEKETSSKLIIEKEFNIEESITQKRKDDKSKQKFEKPHIRAKETSPKLIIEKELKMKESLAEKYEDEKLKQQKAEKPHIKGNETTAIATIRIESKKEDSIHEKIKQTKEKQVEAEKIGYIKDKKIIPKIIVEKPFKIVGFNEKEVAKVRKKLFEKETADAKRLKDIKETKKEKVDEAQLKMKIDKSATEKEVIPKEKKLSVKKAKDKLEALTKELAIKPAISDEHADFYDADALKSIHKKEKHLKKMTKSETQSEKRKTYEKEVESLGEKILGQKILEQKAKIRKKKAVSKSAENLYFEGKQLDKQKPKGGKIFDADKAVLRAQDIAVSEKTAPKRKKFRKKSTQKQVIPSSVSSSDEELFADTLEDLKMLKAPKKILSEEDRIKYLETMMEEKLLAAERKLQEKWKKKKLKKDNIFDQDTFPDLALGKDELISSSKDIPSLSADQAKKMAYTIEKRLLDAERKLKEQQKKEAIQNRKAAFANLKILNSDEEVFGRYLIASKDWKKGIEKAPASEKKRAQYLENLIRGRIVNGSEKLTKRKEGTKARKKKTVLSNDEEKMAKSILAQKDWMKGLEAAPESGTKRAKHLEKLIKQKIKDGKKILAKREKEKSAGIVSSEDEMALYILGQNLWKDSVQEAPSTGEERVLHFEDFIQRRLAEAEKKLRERQKKKAQIEKETCSRIEGDKFAESFLGYNEWIKGLEDAPISSEERSKYLEDYIQNRLIEEENRTKPYDASAPVIDFGKFVEAVLDQHQWTESLQKAPESLEERAKYLEDMIKSKLSNVDNMLGERKKEQIASAGITVSKSEESIFITSLLDRSQWNENLSKAPDTDEERSKYLEDMILNHLNDVNNKLAERKKRLKEDFPHLAASNSNLHLFS